MGSGSSPCASCKLLRRRCTQDCTFAPYFPSNDPYKFANVHKVFGASNVNKMLKELPIHERGDAVSSVVYEANARIKDPVYGCVGTISYLQSQVSQLQMQLQMAQAELLCFRMQQVSSSYYNNDKRSTFNITLSPLQVPESVDNVEEEGVIKTLLLQNSNNLLPSQYFNFGSSSNVIIQDSFKMELLFANDMVS